VTSPLDPQPLQEMQGLDHQAPRVTGELLREPSDDDLHAAFAKSSGGPNPYFRCNRCGMTEPGVRNCLAEHWVKCTAAEAKPVTESAAAVESAARALAGEAAIPQEGQIPTGAQYVRDWADYWRTRALAAEAKASPVVAAGVGGPVGYVSKRDFSRLHTYKGTIWPTCTEIDAVPLYAAPTGVAAEPVSDLKRSLDWSNNNGWHAQRLAEEFHAVYERLAPWFGYETRKATRGFSPHTPNGRLMIAVCGEILDALAATPPAPPQVGQAPKLSDEQIDDAIHKVRRNYSWEMDGLTFCHAIARATETEIHRSLQSTPIPAPNDSY
jgi:hypothetical protein